MNKLKVEIELSYGTWSQILNHAERTGVSVSEVIEDVFEECEEWTDNEPIDGDFDMPIPEVSKEPPTPEEVEKMREWVANLPAAQEERNEALNKAIDDRTFRFGLPSTKDLAPYAIPGTYPPKYKVEFDNLPRWINHPEDHLDKVDKMVEPSFVEPEYSNAEENSLDRKTIVPSFITVPCKTLREEFEEEFKDKSVPDTPLNRARIKAIQMEENTVTYSLQEIKDLCDIPEDTDVSFILMPNTDIPQDRAKSMLDALEETGVITPQESDEAQLNMTEYMRSMKEPKV